jgi:hypothetical protein
MAGVVAERLLEHLERSFVDTTPRSGRAALGHSLEGTWRLESDPADGPALSAPSQLLRPI